jgi:hypothetical protein
VCVCGVECGAFELVSGHVAQIDQACVGLSATGFQNKHCKLTGCENALKWYNFS